MSDTRDYITGNGVLRVSYESGGGSLLAVLKKNGGLFCRCKIEYFGGTIQLQPGYFEELIRERLGQAVIDANQLKSVNIKTSGSNVVELEQTGAFPKNNYPALAHYFLYDVGNKIVAGLQHVLSAKDYSVPVDSNGDRDNVYCHAYIRDHQIILNISTRKHDYDHKKDAEEETAGYGNDPRMPPMALAITDQLFPKFRQELEGEIYRDARHAFIREISLLNEGGSIILKASFHHNIRKGNALYAQTTADLDRMSETGLVLKNKAPEPKINLNALSKTIEDQLLEQLQGQSVPGATLMAIKLADGVKSLVRKALDGLEK